MNQTRRVFWFCTAFILLLLSPWIIFSTIFTGLHFYGKIDEMIYQSTHSFDAARWQKPDLKYRYAVLNEVLKSQLNPGMSKSDIQAILGSPDCITSSGDWQFETQRPGWHLVDFSGGGILITFSNGLLKSAEDNRWVD